MKLGIINSAFGQAGVDTVTGLRHISRIGFDCVDIFTEAATLSGEEKRDIARTCSELNLPIISLPVVAVGLVDFNDPVRQFHLERCKKFIDLAAEWKAKNILLVLGEYIWQREVIPPARAEFINVTLRYIGAGDIASMSFAPGPRIAAVMSFSQKITTEGEIDMLQTTEALIDRILAIGGAFYLPYRLHARRDQVTRAYPKTAAFIERKRFYDPGLLFRNAMWDAYFA